MSDRSLFPEGCEVHQSHLQNESEFRMSDMSRIITGAASSGITSGLGVTVNVGDTTKVDVAAGSAYAPNGSFMTLASANVGLSLASNVLGTVNYILLVYDEVQSDPETHKSNGTTQYTKATNSPRVVVVTQSAYNALPASNTVLSTNAKDRAVIIAAVTATGGALSAGNISLPPTFGTVFTATIQTNLTGVTPLAVSSDTSTGTGSLVWNSGGSTLTYTSPGGTAGTPVAISTSNVYLVTDGGGKTLSLDVAVSMLPLSNTTATVTISDLYSQTASRFSLKDVQHRAQIGSGIPTSNNPHGMTIDDLAPGAAGSLEEHQDIMHTDGIGRGSSASLLSVVVNTGVAPDTMTVTGFSAGDSAYVNGKRITAISGLNTLSAPATASMTTEQVYLSEDGTVGRRTHITYATTALSGIVQVLNAVGFPDGNVTLTYTNTGNLYVTDTYGAGHATASTANDYFVRLYSKYGPSRYLDVYVKASSTPGVTINETLTISNAQPGQMVIATVPWSGSGTGFLGYGFGAASSPNGVYDLRRRGNLDATNVRSDSGIAAFDKMTGAFTNGILIPKKTNDGSTVGTFDPFGKEAVVTAAGGLNINVTGGRALIGGVAVEFPNQTLALAPSTTNRVFITSDGVVRSTTNTWDWIAATYNGRYVSLSQVTTTGVAVSILTDAARWLSYRKDEIGGVVGLDYRGRVSLAAPTTGTTLTVDGGNTAPSVSISGTNTAALLSVQSSVGVAIAAGTTDLVANAIEASSSGGGAGVLGSSTDGPGLYGLGLNPTSQGVLAVNSSSGPGLYATSVSGNSIEASLAAATQNGTFIDMVSASATAKGIFIDNVPSGVNNAGIRVDMATPGFGSGLTTDGVVSADRFLKQATATGTIFIPADQFRSSGATTAFFDTTSGLNVYPQGASSIGTLGAIARLPRGASVTHIYLAVDNTTGVAWTGATVTGTIFNTSGLTGTPSTTVIASAATGSVASTGFQWISIAPVTSWNVPTNNVPVSTGLGWLMLKISSGTHGTGSVQIFGIALQYSYTTIDFMV